MESLMDEFDGRGDDSALEEFIDVYSPIIAATLPAAAPGVDEAQQTVEAVAYLESIGAPATEDRVLWARFLATQPTVEQVHLASSLVVEDRTRHSSEASISEAELDEIEK